MEFGIYLRREKTYPKMLQLAKKAEKLGFMGGFLNDHVIGFADDGKEDYLEAFTAMTGIGVQTTKLRVGQIVLFNSLRNPAFLAKSIATVDQMTNGRYECMIGAGWNEKEYLGYDLMEKGRGMPSAGERVSRFEESIQILKLMLSQKEVDFEGNYWKLKRAINTPLPVQQPMRISVGCSKPRMMDITARHADGINISAFQYPKIKDLLAKFEEITEKYSKKINDYYVSGFSAFRVAETEEQMKEMAKEGMKRSNKTYEEYVAENFIGTPERITGMLKDLKDRGIDMFVSVIEIHENVTDDPLTYFRDNIMKQF